MFKVGEHNFATNTAARKFFKRLVAEGPEDIPPGGKLHDLVLSLLRCHYADKIGPGVRSFHITPNAEGHGRGFKFARVDDTWDQFSYTNVLDHMTGPYLAKVARWRREIHDDVRAAATAYITEHGLPKCGLSGRELTEGRWELHHRPPHTFAYIAATFEGNDFREHHATMAEIDFVDRKAHRTAHETMSLKPKYKKLHLKIKCLHPTKNKL